MDADGALEGPRGRKRRRETETSAASDTEHVITTRGPEPKGQRTAPIDYAHYLGKQLAPVCDVVLLPLGTSFERIAGAQTSLF